MRKSLTRKAKLVSDRFMNHLSKRAKKDHNRPAVNLAVGVIALAFAVLYPYGNVPVHVGFGLAGTTLILINALTISGHIRNNGRLQSVVYAISTLASGIIILAGNQISGILFILLGLTYIIKAREVKQ